MWKQSEAAWQERGGCFGETQAQLTGSPTQLSFMGLSPHLRTGDSHMLSAELFMWIRDTHART